MVLGERRNILINKDCYSANEATNQAVGSSNLSGRANTSCLSVGCMAIITMRATQVSNRLGFIQ